MKVLFLFLCFGGILSIASKPLVGTDESKENDILQEILKEMIDQWKSGNNYFFKIITFRILPVVNSYFSFYIFLPQSTDSKGKSLTAKQQAWWDSLGVRHPQSERKQNLKMRKEVRQLTGKQHKELLICLKR